MARARNIKPSFFANDDLADIDPLGRLLFIGLWTVADRDGRLEDRPRRIKAEVLPYDDCDIDTLLGDLQKHGFIHRYEVGGERFIQVVNFAKHQNPHVKESASSIPAPDEHHARPVQEQGKAHPEPEQVGLIPDSGFLDTNNPPNPPAGGESPTTPKRERKPRIQLKTFIDNCRAAGENAISGYKPLLEYVEATGLPMEFVQLAWDEFKRQFGPGGKDEARKQADWRRHFLNYIEKNYMRLWYARVADGGNEYFLSTQGLQAQALQSNREAVA
ncbi:hypothetical protein [Pusillimonas noertemannii]|uniref:Uncharacterized protein n=1 Tax=Pusillimonas noertemannii TaxID=305977 RepID=A0A2U1CRU7_9BURK|nr:hypothetical protein [Pusillimonas noertemannii]NYT67954.1 phage replication protein [Pusillimonas noertemannii]PVY68627.1 hypothetical protein C7440_1038 [Pusillimonas noertemannii]TFL11905.1 hypothetical protein CSC72_01885 [Pusillimonas noertemannii]